MGVEIGGVPVTFARRCPVCGMTWALQSSRQHVACIRDRHIVEQHPDHVMAIVAPAMSVVWELHPLDEPCADTETTDVQIAVMPVIQDARRERASGRW